ncbi:hypothetical protein J7K05_01580 [bacterium]|nr:hypothetical protein [bacterium]
MFKSMFQGDAQQRLEEGEEIVIFLHRHWLAMLPVFLAVLVLILFPILVFVAYSYFDLSLLLEEWGLLVSPSKILAFFFAVYFLFLDFFCLVAWIQYYLDVTILTNRRLVDIEQVNIFQRQVASTDLVYIQDVSSEVKGFLPSLLDYGRVVVQTAGERPNFILENIPHPSAVARQILVTAQGKTSTQVSSGEELIKRHEEEVFSSMSGGKLVPSSNFSKKERQSRSEGVNISGKEEVENKEESRDREKSEDAQSGEIDLT